MSCVDDVTRRPNSSVGPGESHSLPSNIAEDCEAFRGVRVGVH